MLLIISVVCFFACRIKIKDFIKNVHVFYIMGAIILAIGCLIIYLIYDINALKRSLLLGKFSHLRSLILPSYISFMIAIMGSIEKIFRRIFRN